MGARCSPRAGLKLKYYSAPTLDPWSDLVASRCRPITPMAPAAPGKHLEFIRPHDVDQAELVFSDELNRAHPKVHNAVLEMIQFKSINGTPLPNVRMVWAAINPPGDIYSVSELDPALEDRFQLHLPVKAAPSAQYYRDRAGIPEHIATALILWWQRDLQDELRRLISPRRAGVSRAGDRPAASHGAGHSAVDPGAPAEPDPAHRRRRGAAVRV